MKERGMNVTHSYTHGGEEGGEGGKEGCRRPHASGDMPVMEQRTL